MWHETSTGGKPFPVCNGCKGPVYCSKQCQKLHWKVHKTLCQHTSGFVAQHQQLIKTHRSLLLSNDNFPPEEHRLNLIQNFIQAYSWYFKRTVYDVLRYLRLEETFDFLKTHCSLSRRLWWQYKCCVLSLRDGIPPFGRRGEREPRSCEEPRGSPTDTSFTKLGRSLNPDIIGTMRIGWTMEDYCIWRKWEYSRLTPGCRKYQGNLERQIQNGWFGDFQDLVENGLTYTQPAGGRTWSLGTFKKQGKNWRWQQLTPAELVSHGFLRDHGVTY